MCILSAGSPGQETEAPGEKGDHKNQLKKGICSFHGPLGAEVTWQYALIPRSWEHEERRPQSRG